MKSSSVFALLSITVIWGWTFVLIKQGMSQVGPFTFLAIRFFIALAVLAILLRRHLRPLSLRSLRAGLIVGTALFSGYLFQTWGLVYTTATKSGLLTGLSVVIVPLAASLLFGKRVKPLVWFGALLAAGGLFLLVAGNEGSATLNRGDLLTLICAVSFAFHIILIDRFVRTTDYRQLLLVQVAVVTLFSFIGAATIERFSLTFSGAVIEGILITGVFATAVAYYVLNRFQSSSTASYTAIILTMEPVFAGLFGFLLLGEKLGRWQLIGSIMILLGMIIPSVWKRTI